jgi:hypothetical protein
LPERRDRRPPRPRAVIAGTRVVVAVDDRLGLFEVASCISSERSRDSVDGGVVAM